MASQHHSAISKPCGLSLLFVFTFCSRPCYPRPSPSSLFAQPAPDAFRWIDFHSAKDQDVITWVTRSLTVENWSAIREIGVEYDAALVVTTTRPSPQSLPASDTFTVWSLSLTNHSYVASHQGS